MFCKPVKIYDFRFVFDGFFCVLHSVCVVFPVGGHVVDVFVPCGARAVIVRERKKKCGKDFIATGSLYWREKKIVRTVIFSYPEKRKKARRRW